MSQTCMTTVRRDRQFNVQMHPLDKLRVLLAYVRSGLVRAAARYQCRLRQHGGQPGRDTRLGPPGRGRAFFFFKQKTAYEIGLGIPAEPLFRSPVRRAIMFMLVSW